MQKAVVSQLPFRLRFAASRVAVGWEIRSTSVGGEEEEAWETSAGDPWTVVASAAVVVPAASLKTDRAIRPADWGQIWTAGAMGAPLPGAVVEAVLGDPVMETDMEVRCAPRTM